MRSHISMSRFITDSPLGLESNYNMWVKQLDRVSQRRLARLKLLMKSQNRAGGGGGSSVMMV